MDKPNETPPVEPTQGATAGTPPHHEHHQAVLNRLSRIEGHVRAIKRMVEEDAPCPDVLVQIAAVRAALQSLGRVVLEDHLQSCIVQAVQDGAYEEAMRDLRRSLDRFIG